MSAQPEIFKYDFMGSYMGAREELTLTETKDSDNSVAEVLSAFPSLTPFLPSSQSLPF